MKTKFNKFERIAGLFVLSAVVGSLAVMIMVAVQQAWFERKVSYHTTVEKADGIFPGTKVKISGIKVGRVTDVILNEDSIQVELSIRQSFMKKIREDSEISISRPFVIGEKVIEISTGDASLPILTENKYIPTTHSFDLIEMMNPRAIGPHLESLAKLAENMKFIAESFLDEKRSKAFVEMFDELKPLLKNANVATIEIKKISDQMTTNGNLKTVMSNVAFTTSELNKEIEGLMSLTRSLPEMTQDIGVVMKNLSALTEAMNKVIPALTEVAPELPRASRRAIEAMDEAVIVLKAMQKSFMLKSSVEAVREEEERSRIPANTDDEDWD
ncbi:MAG: MlaD family protein [Bdellovibrionales bacterium]